jgi:hypothetical protein
MMPEEEVLDGLRREADRYRREAYPGDLLADIRPLLGTRARRSRARWQLAAAGLVAAALVAHLASRGPASSARVRSLSPFQTIPRATALSMAPPRTLSPTPTQMGRALRLGAGALSSLRPPSRASSVPEEEAK